MNSPAAVGWLVVAAVAFALTVYVFAMTVEKRTERRHGPKHPDVQHARATTPPPADAVTEHAPELCDQQLDDEHWRGWEQQVQS